MPAHYQEVEDPQYNGVSNIVRKKSINSDFKERFQGRNSLMNKDGHIGVVKNTNQPIKKVEKQDFPRSQKSIDVTPQMNVR